MRAEPGRVEGGLRHRPTCFAIDLQRNPVRVLPEVQLGPTPDDAIQGQRAGDSRLPWKSLNESIRIFVQGRATAWEIPSPLRGCRVTPPKQP